MFDITCTATLRPELLKITLDSHINRLFSDSIKEANFIINIDQVGINDFSKKNIDLKLVEIIDLISSYGFSSINVNVSQEPNFASAFWWCMNNIKSDYFFHLEEDWELLIDIDFKKMFDIITSNKYIAHLRLSAFNSELYSLKNWNKYLYWNGVYYEVNQEDKSTIGWCGHPSLNRSIFIKECMNYINLELNPEKELKGRRYNHPINSVFNKYNFGCYHPRNQTKAINDIGRKWMVENGWKKKGCKAFFTNWEKDNR